MKMNDKLFIALTATLFGFAAIGMSLIAAYYERQSRQYETVLDYEVQNFNRQQGNCK